MATNLHRKRGENISLPVPSDTESGDAVQVGGIVGVCLTDEGAEGNADDHATVATVGAFDLDVTGNITAVGQPVYITDANVVTATASTNALLGHALSTGNNAVISVRLAQHSTVVAS